MTWRLLRAIRGRPIHAGLIAVCGLSACATPGSRVPVPLREPPVAATAPPVTGTPAGRVIRLKASRPEGVAVDSRTGTVLIAAQDNTLLSVPHAGPAFTVPRGGLGASTVRTLPAAGRHVRVTLNGPDLALIPLESSGQLALIGVPAGRTVALAVGPAPHDATPIPGDRALVGDEGSGQVSIVTGLVDPATATVSQRLPAGLQPGGVAAAGNLACAVDVRGRYLYRYDVRPGQPVRSMGKVAVGAGPTHVIALDGDRVAVADAIGKAVYVVSLTEGKVLSQRPLSQAPEGLAFDSARHRLWVTTPGANTLTDYSLTGDDLAPITSYPTVRQANSVAVDPSGTAYVAGATPEGTLQVLPP